MPNHTLKIKNRRIVFAGGGTGGHLWPLVSIVRYARKHINVIPIYFGTGSKLERRVWRREGVRQFYIPSGKRRGYASWRNIFDYLWFAMGFLKSLVWLVALRPAVVFGKGGYGMLPTVWAARILKITVVSHESDIVLGRANRFALDRGALVLTAFPTDFYEVRETQRGLLRYIGMPVHPDFYSWAGNDDVRLTVGQDHASGVRKHILVFGGSQGSVRINEMAAKLWPRLTELGKVTHVTGRASYKAFSNMYRNLEPEVREHLAVVEELDGLPQHLKKASLVICRAGATSLWEVAASKVPTIAVPLPESASDHQRLNALWFAQEFPWITLLEEKDIDTDVLWSRIKHKIESAAKEHVLDKGVIMPGPALRAVGRVLDESLVASYFGATRRFHLIGSRGVSMQGIGAILAHDGHLVTGSDLSLAGHDAHFIDKKLDAVIYTSAAARKEAAGYVEIAAAEKLGIPALKRSLFIKHLVNNRKLVTVSGMHGKSTTSSMVAHILRQRDWDPSYLIGVPDIQPTAERVGGAHRGTCGVFVLESCEYDRSFYDFPSDVAVITNIEAEHLDYFKGGIGEIKEAFVEFLDRSRPAAHVIIPNNKGVVGEVLKLAAARRPDIKIVESDKIIIEGKIESYRFFGRHNLANAQMAVAATRVLGVSEKDAWAALRDFRGAKRRMELVGELGDSLIYDDYGHHPTEIHADYEALRHKYPKKRLIVVFQPHQVSRTKEFFEDFAKELARFDEVVVTDIYKVAGREEKETVTAKDLVAAVARRNKNAQYIALPYENIVKYLHDKSLGDAVVLTMGATNINEVARSLVL